MAKLSPFLLIRRNQETTDKEEYVMKKFRVTVTETLKRFVEVEAENEDKAAEKVDFMYDNEDIVLTADDYYATNITVDELPEQVQETARKRNGSAR